MAAQQAGSYLTDSVSFTPAEQAAGNDAFNYNSVNSGVLGTEIGQGSFSASNTAFDTDPMFGFDPDLSINLNGAATLQNPNAPQGGSQPAGGAPPSSKAKSIADIKSQLLRPATTSHFICRFTPPKDVEDFEKQRESSGLAGASYTNVLNGELIELSCCDASLPGSTLATHDINNDFHGMTQKNAYRRLYDDMADFTFYLDRNYTALRFFEGWIAYIVNERISGGQGIPRFTDNFFYYRVNYPKTYKCDTLYITKFEKDTGRPDAGPNLEYRFFEAFPIRISSIPVSYESSQLLKCTVSFTFSKYLINYSKPSAPAKSSTSPAAQNAPGVPELNTIVDRPTTQSPIDEIRNMQEASRLRQAGYSAGLGQEGRYGPGF
jgi:hypothetical protein